MLDVRAWLSELGLDRYADAFDENDIDGRALVRLDDQDLREIGVKSLGHRRVLLGAIEGLSIAPASSFSTTKQGTTPRDARELGRDAEHRQLTVMFCDLVGSTALSERLDPEELRTLMGAYRQTAGDVVARYDGYVAQYLGDGLMIYFGWPRAHEDDAERAVRVGLEIVNTVKAVAAPEPLRVRIGIATGPVVVGEGADDDAEANKLAVGETPNIAARLQGLAGANEVVITQLTHNLVRGAFEYDDLGDRSLKGLGESVRVWRVKGTSDVQGRFEASASADLTPFVGRQSEVAQLMEHWEQAKGGEGQVTLVSGEPGIGKSRLIETFRALIAEEAHTRLRYQCSPYHSNSAFYPFIDQIGRAADFVRDESSDDKVAKLLELLALATDEPDPALGAFASLMMLDHEITKDMSALSPGERKEHIAEALLEQLAGLAEQRPVLVICEDIQWIDPSSLEILDMLVERLPKLRVFGIFSFRTEFEPAWIGRPHVNVMVLNRLSARLVGTLVSHLMGAENFTESEKAEIIEKADGIPLFAEELTRTLWEARGAAGNGFTIPSTLRDALMARVDDLGEMREILQAAAIIGREFAEDVLIAATGLPASGVRGHIDRLVTSRLIERRGTGAPARYSFRQALIQEITYESLLRDRRRQIHLAVANHLEQTDPENVANRPENIARHFSEAGEWPRAADYWLQAAEIAKARFANTEATEHLEAGLAADKRDPVQQPDRRATMMTVYGDLESRDGNLGAANAWYEKAIEMVDDPTSRLAIENHRHVPRQVFRDGARLAFYEHGRGEDTLLFVNPALYGLAIFQPILEELCDSFRIITVDCRGTGDSDPLIRPFSVSEHVKDLEAIIDEAGSSSLVGVGISRGCSHLSRLAVNRPGLMSKLVLIGSSVASLAKDDRYGPPENFVKKIEAALQKGDLTSLLRTHLSLVFSESGTRHVAEQFQANAANLPTETMLNFYEPDPEIDVRPLLSKLALPTLVMHGTDDQVMPFAGAEYLASHIEGAQLYAFDAKGHLPLFTATAEFCSALRTFVEGR